MNLHEYQAKHLLAENGLPVPDGEIAHSVDDVRSIIERFKGCVVKAQIHAGGRGKSGGVKVFPDVKAQKDDIITCAQTLLGTRLVTYQTDADGQPVDKLLIEETSSIAKELYVGAVVDRDRQRVTFMCSTEGGVEIEKVASETPEKILKFSVDPLVGVMPYQAREIAFGLELQGDQVKQMTKILMGLGKMFRDSDLSLIEINPLIITEDGDLLCLDCKINIDDNALFRQPKIREMRDPSQEDERVNHAHDWDLNYVPLDGDIGCMVNGAGLAMATMDVIKLHGGEPANFLDVGGGATKERVSEAFKIILSDKNVKGILVNIFGGIVRCDLIAEGIIGAVAESDINVPVVVRLEGNNAQLGSKKLKESGLNLIPAEGLTDAAKKIVAAV